MLCINVKHHWLVSCNLFFAHVSGAIKVNPINQWISFVNHTHYHNYGMIHYWNNFRGLSIEKQYVEKLENMCT